MSEMSIEQLKVLLKLEFGTIDNAIHTWIKVKVGTFKYNSNQMLVILEEYTEEHDK